MCFSHRNCLRQLILLRLPQHITFHRRRFAVVMTVMNTFIRQNDNGHTDTDTIQIKTEQKTDRTIKEKTVMFRISQKYIRL